MNVTIVIDRLVLDGVTVAAEEQSAFSEALATHLRDLLVARPPPPGGPAAASRVRAHPVPGPAAGCDAGTVADIAASVHAVLVAPLGAGNRPATGRGNRR